MKSANIMLKGDTAYLNSISSTNFLKIDTPPFIVINWKEQDVNQKVNLIHEVLEAAKEKLEFPENPSAYSKYILDSFGFKSFSQMYKNAINCGIEFDDAKGVFIFVPTKTVKNGVEGLKEGSQEISIHSSAEKIIDILERVLERCE